MAETRVAGSPAAAADGTTARVAALLRRSLDRLAAEVPASYQHLVDALGPLVVEVEIDGELFSVRGNPNLVVADGRSGAAGVRIGTSRAAVLAVLDAELALGEAVEEGAVQVQGSLDDVVRAHDALLAYAHAAVRAPSVPGLLDALRAGGRGAR
jgi:hypothetical protein